MFGHCTRRNQRRPSFSNSRGLLRDGFGCGSVRRLLFEPLEERRLLGASSPFLVALGQPTVETFGNASVNVSPYVSGFGNDNPTWGSFKLVGNAVADGYGGGDAGGFSYEASGLSINTEPGGGAEIGDPVTIRVYARTQAVAYESGLSSGTTTYTYDAAAPQGGGTLISGTRSGGAWNLPEDEGEYTFVTTIGTPFQLDFSATASLAAGPIHVVSFVCDFFEYEVEILTLPNEPPSTTHQFSGNDKDSIEVTLTATDDSGLEKTVYEIFGRDGSSERHEKTASGAMAATTQFTIDLDDVETIHYFSVDTDGAEEQPHTIGISPPLSAKQDYGVRPFNGQFIYYPYGQPPGYPNRYEVYITAHYFNISDEACETIFVDQIDVDTGTSLAGVYVTNIVALRLLRNGETIRMTSEGAVIGYKSASWEVGAADWVGHENDYEFQVQFRAQPPDAYLSMGEYSIPIITPAGGWAINWTKYWSDKTFTMDIPPKGSWFQRLQNWITPSQARIHNIEIENETAQASLGVSWQGSDLDLVLRDPNGREITPQVAATDPDIEFVGGATYEEYTVLSPVPGTWTMVATAIDVP